MGATDKLLEGDMRLRAQLNFGGNCEEAFRFYEKNLGGKITVMLDQSHMPGGSGGKAIIHARMTIGDTELVGNDVPSGTYAKSHSVYLLLSTDSDQEAERVHAILAERGEV